MKKLNYFLSELNKLTKETGIVIETNYNCGININKLEKDKYAKEGYYSCVTKDNDKSNTLAYDLLWEYDGEE